MCFYAKKQRSRAVKVEEPITGFKRLKVRAGKISSPYRKKIYWHFDEEKTEPSFEKQAQYGEVNVGLHCYKSLSEARYHLKKGERIYLVTIPVGALVHENDTQWCSDTMILDRFELTRPKRKK